MGSSKFPFDIEAYKRQSGIKEMYIVNRFRECQNKIEEDYAPRSKIKYNKENHVAANQRLIEDYFADQPTYDDAMFYRRFWMQKHVFFRIVGDMSSSDNYFTNKLDAANKEAKSPLAKCTTSMRMLAYGVVADTVDEYTKIGSTITLECGLSGMIASIDCMHWEWKNCPTMWEGQFTRVDKETTTVFLEVVASHDIWIWHVFFGCPGTLNDINVLDRSPMFDDVEQRNTTRVNFSLNQRPYNMDYYLADGIYHSYPIFIKSIRIPQSEPDKLFAQRQEGCQKDIERAFGVLQAPFKIILEPARMWGIADLAIIMRSCIILHNMIVEDERDTYAQHSTNYDQFEK